MPGSGAERPLKTLFRYRISSNPSQHPPGHTVSLAFEVRDEIFVGMFVQRGGRAPTKDPIATSNLLQLHLRRITVRHYDASRVYAESDEIS